MNYEENISKILREERINMGLSIRDLAKLAGVSPTTICEVEKKNNTKHAFTTIAKIAKVLDINLNYLAEEINNNEEEVNNNYVIKIKKISDNCYQFYSESNELLLEFLQNIGFEIDAFDLKIGEEIKLDIRNVFSEDEQEDYYYCPYCNAELD